MASDLVARKTLLRSSVKKLLKSFTSDYISNSSQQCIQHVQSLPEFQKCVTVASYVAMPTEIQTMGLIDASLSLQKRVCIPKVLGKTSGDMIMIELSSADTLASLPKNSWGIPEHSLEMIRDGGLTDYNDGGGVIDFLVIPGVAFDDRGNRLGHGKGYYGKN